MISTRPVHHLSPRSSAGRRVTCRQRHTRVWLLLVSALLSAASVQAVEVSADAWETPLHWAAEHGLVDIAGRLIENGAAVNATDQFGRRPLHLAVEHPDVVQLLLDAGASINAADAFSRTALHMALQIPETVRILLAAGASITAKDFLGRTPLQRTLSFGTSRRNLEVINLLLDAGAGGASQ